MSYTACCTWCGTCEEAGSMEAADTPGYICTKCYASEVTRGKASLEDDRIRPDERGGEGYRAFMQGRGWKPIPTIDPEQIPGVTG